MCVSSVRRTVLAFVRVCPPSGKFSLSGTLCRRSRSSSTLLSHKTSKYDTAHPHSCLQPSHWSSASGGRGGNSSQDWLPLAQKGSCTSPLGSVVRIGAVAAAAVSSASENHTTVGTGSRSSSGSGGTFCATAAMPRRVKMAICELGPGPWKASRLFSSHVPPPAPSKRIGQLHGKEALARGHAATDRAGTVWRLELDVRDDRVAVDVEAGNARGALITAG